MSFAADLRAFYIDFGVSVVTTHAQFLGLLDTADRTAYDTADIGTHQLRYVESAVLAAGEAITVGGSPFKVHGSPRRINSEEFIAQLVSA